MELKQLIEHHSKCLICQSPLQIKPVDLTGLVMSVDSERILVKYIHNKMFISFKYDGTYEKDEHCPELRSRPFSILIECPKCVSEPEVIIKHRSIGYTTTSLYNEKYLKSLKFCYQINLFAGIENRFRSHFISEVIRYNDGINFYHIHTSEQTSSVWYGPIKNGDKHNLQQTCYYKVPSINTSGLTDISQLINKIKIYNLFS